MIAKSIRVLGAAEHMDTPAEYIRLHVHLCAPGAECAARHADACVVCARSARADVDDAGECRVTVEGGGATAHDLDDACAAERQRVPGDAATLQRIHRPA